MLQFTLLSFRKLPISRNLGVELLINFHHYLVIKKTFHSCDICELPDGCPHDLQTTNNVKAPQLMKNFTYKSLYNEFVIIICLTFTSGPHRSLVLLLIWIQYTHQSPGLVYLDLAQDQQARLQNLSQTSFRQIFKCSFWLFIN